MLIFFISCMYVELLCLCRQCNMHLLKLFGIYCSESIVLLLERMKVMIFSIKLFHMVTFYLLFLCAFLFSLLYFFFYLFYFHVPSNMSLHKSGRVYFENHGSVDSMHPFSLSFNDLISITETRIKSLLCNGYRGISNWKNPTICELYI